MMSITQSSNVGVIVGMIVLVLNYFKISISSEEISAVIGAGIVIISTVRSWVNRQADGDLTPFGFVK